MTVATLITQEMHADACVAARNAAIAYSQKHFGGGDGGACGFAWVTAHVKGNTKVGKSFIKVGYRKAYGGGYDVWNPSGVALQSVDAKAAGADAYVAVIRKYLPEVKIYSGSRLD